MRLRSKLSIVLALLVSTLIANVVLSIWSIRFLERELSSPLLSMQSVMKRLHTMKRSGEEEIDLISVFLETQSAEEVRNPLPAEWSGVHSRISTIESENIRLLHELEELPGVMLRSGVTTIENLLDRSANISTLNERWADTISRSDAQQLISLIDKRHELIELVEGQILDDSKLASDFGNELRSRMQFIILVTLIGALAIGLLMVIFVRGWILTPIERLRAGAHRMGQGDFRKQIEVYTNDELGQLSDEFNRMGVLIQEMQDQRVERERLAAMGEMAQRTVHNFRTPLSSIRALSEVVLEDLEVGSDAYGFQSRILSTVDRFNLQLSEMLRSSSPLELIMKTFDPATLVGSVIADHQGASQSKDQQIKLSLKDPPDSVFGDPHHLGHAITAILSNAVEYAPGSSLIDVRLGMREENGVDYWTLRIANSGPMVPSDLHRSIFRPYFTTRQTGTGIGLAMTQRVIDQHCGRISIESPLNTTKNSGCAFTMLIPVTPAV